jgi:hypothetical protein
VLGDGGAGQREIVNSLDRGGKRRVACDARVIQRQDAGERRIGARREDRAPPFPGARLIRKVYVRALAPQRAAATDARGVDDFS